MAASGPAGVSVPAAPPTVTGLLLAQAGSPQPGLRFEDRSWSWREHVGECARYAAALRARRAPGLPFHVGVLADNVPEFSFLLGGCAFAGAVLVALNPVRRGSALARTWPAPTASTCSPNRATRRCCPRRTSRCCRSTRSSFPAHAPLDVAPAAPDDLLMLIFTSGTSGEPKAVRCTHGKIAIPGQMLAGRFGLGTGDTVYVSMPMFHSNAIMAGWAVGLAAGAAIALRRRFSASGFLPDVRAFGATYANYVGKPLSYVLATPERADDADNPLRIAYGNEGAPGDLARFAERFGCRVIDGFGSTEGGIAVSRTPDTPPGALGRLTDGVAVLDPETGRPCPPARFGSARRAAQPGRGRRRAGEHAGNRPVRRVLPRRGGGRDQDARRHVLERRPGLRGRPRVLLVRRADRASGCGSTGRTSAPRRSSGPCCATPPSPRRRCTGCPIRSAGDQVMACVVVRGGAR